MALLTSESWELLKLVKDPPATKGREIAFHRLMSVTKDLNQSKASEEVIYKALVNSWRFSRHLGTFASVIKDPCLQKLWNWGGDNLVQRCRFYFLKFLLEIEFNDSFFSSQNLIEIIIGSTFIFKNLQSTCIWSDIFFKEN